MNTEDLTERSSGCSVKSTNMATKLLQKLIAFKSTVDNPEAIKEGFEYISSLFDAAKYEKKVIEKNGVYSLLVSFKGKDALRPKILLNGHFDVVPGENNEQYQMKVENGYAYGRGTLDMKGMVGVLIEVLLELGKQENAPNVALLLNGDEEIGGVNGCGYCVKELGLRPKFVLCADGGSEEQLELITKEKGVLWLELVAKGKSAHGAYPWLGENAVEKLLVAIEKIKKMVGETEPRAWKSTFNIGVLETTNKTPNKVPAEARAVVDIRFTEALTRTPAALLGKIKNTMPEVTIRTLEKGDMLFIEETNSFVRMFKEIAERVIGKEVPFAYAHGSTDARYFGALRIPCLVFGAIGGNAHAEGEWVDLESLEKNKEVLLRFLQNA